MNLPDNTELINLRLELGRMTDKANALEAALRKEVLAIVRDEIRKAKACDAEIDRLNAIIESHKDAGKRVLAILDEERRNSSLLKAEVERLRSQFANSEWQPIETAPKDGQDILAYRHPHGAFLIPYYWGNDTYQMTHWMPLPKPPAAKEGKPSV